MYQAAGSRQLALGLLPRAVTDAEGYDSGARQSSGSVVVFGRCWTRSVARRGMPIVRQESLVGTDDRNLARTSDAAHNGGTLPATACTGCQSLCRDRASTSRPASGTVLRVAASRTWWSSRLECSGGDHGPAGALLAEHALQCAR